MESLNHLKSIFQQVSIIKYKRNFLNGYRCLKSVVGDFQSAILLSATIWILGTLYSNCTIKFGLHIKFISA